MYLFSCSQSVASGTLGAPTLETRAMTFAWEGHLPQGLERLGVFIRDRSEELRRLGLKSETITLMSFQRVDYRLDELPDLEPLGIKVLL